MTDIKQNFVGFFGPVPGSILHQVGRGYTDLLSALLAVGLSASELQIWKEVDGIFTADPRKVPTARLIPIISPAEAAELTYYGSEVVHPFTMEQVCVFFVAIDLAAHAILSGHPEKDLHQDQECRKSKRRRNRHTSRPRHRQSSCPTRNWIPKRAGAGLISQDA